jgi:hypothetical protein
MTIARRPTDLGEPERAPRTFLTTPNVVPEAAPPECECPEACLLDHDN